MDSHADSRQRPRWPWSKKPLSRPTGVQSSNQEDVEAAVGSQPPKWSMGMLNDKYTDEVPGSVLLMSKREAAHNEPLGLRHVQGRASASSLPPSRSLTPGAGPSPRVSTCSRRPLSRAASRTPSTIQPEVKKTANGQIILEPQPDDSANDPLNWPVWRRDMALLSLGFFCMLGGGMTTVLAAGFTNVAATYDVSVPQVSLTTGLYMLGLGFGSVIFSPTAILYGKRPVYLLGGVLFVLSSVWCALSPNYPSLIVARIFQGIAVSPVECLPSATIAEIFFLHERAYRLGVYTLLLLGGKNLVPLVSAAVINSLGWRWVFWVVALVVGFGTTLLFFFVPETFWDRTPVPSKHKHKNPLAALTALFSPSASRHHSRTALASIRSVRNLPDNQDDQVAILGSETPDGEPGSSDTLAVTHRQRSVHAHFADDSSPDLDDTETPTEDEKTQQAHDLPEKLEAHIPVEKPRPALGASEARNEKPVGVEDQPTIVEPDDYFGQVSMSEKAAGMPGHPDTEPTPQAYTDRLASGPTLSYWQTLRPCNGRLRKDSWVKCMVRPFVLFAYPSILWSALVYALSVGWLIVLSEAVSAIYRSEEYSYNFSALQAGLVYLSPFIGGILGTAVAGRISDVIVRAMSRRNDGIYEPEFRLVMTVPILISTVAGLMGFGWSVQERDAWIVPTVFFGVISFGCTLGSTTAITFAVDSYRVYAGEALVTLNFSKNVLHGFVFSLFFTGWLETDGAKTVFMAIGAIQIVCLLTSIPMYIYGKRARMWTVRKNMMEKF